MPKPVLFPAPPPVISAKGGKKSKKSSKGSRKEGGEAAYPQGRKDALATSAAACLRFMSSCPGFVEQLMGEHSQPVAKGLNNYVILGYGIMNQRYLFMAA